MLTGLLYSNGTKTINTSFKKYNSNEIIQKGIEDKKNELISSSTFRQGLVLLYDWKGPCTLWKLVKASTINLCTWQQGISQLQSGRGRLCQPHMLFICCAWVSRLLQRYARNLAQCSAQLATFEKLVNLYIPALLCL